MISQRLFLEKPTAPRIRVGVRRKGTLAKTKGQWTTLIIIDSQAVKNTCNASVKSKGFCFYKATNGIKRHLAVDTLGFPFFSHCTKASLSDDMGLIEMLSDNIDILQIKTSEHSQDNYPT